MELRFRRSFFRAFVASWSFLDSVEDGYENIMPYEDCLNFDEIGDFSKECPFASLCAGDSFYLLALLTL